MIKKGLILAGMIVAFSLSSFAQTRGKIEGIVTDSEKNPLEKVTIVIISTKTAATRFNISTDKKGKFTQIGIWPGYYQVTFQKEGFIPAYYEVKVAIAESTKLDVKMLNAEKAIEKALSDADRLFLRGYKLYEQQKYEAAVQSYQEAIKLNSLNWGYYFNLGLAYKKMKENEEAMAAFRKAVELNPESYSSNKELGEMLGKAKKFEEAKKYYKKAVELNQDDHDTYYNLGLVLIALGEREEALEAFLRVTDLKQDYAEAYYEIGTICIGQNNIDEAVINLEKFLELSPEHEKAATARQMLDYLKK